jgi:hypothetical protein
MKDDMDLILASENTFVPRTGGGPNGVCILQNVHCQSCNWPIIDICCNTGVKPWDDWDWWQYCSNPSCKNHPGEGVFQNTPDWIISNE